MKETIKKYLEEFKIGTKTMFKEFFNKETNKKQMDTSIDMKISELIIENNGKQPNSFDIIEKLYESDIITDNQKVEMITNGGELKVGEEVIRINTSEVINNSWSETIQTGDKWRLKFKCRLNKIAGVEYIEFGTMLLPDFILDSYKPEVEIIDKFTLENSDKLTTLIIKAENYIDDENGYDWNATLFDIPESSKNDMVFARSYAKYKYNGVEGVIYSDIVQASVETHK